MKPKKLRLELSVIEIVFRCHIKKSTSKFAVYIIQYFCIQLQLATSSLIRFSAVKEVLLRIKSMSTKDAGTWECRATNNAGKYSVVKFARVRVN